MGNTEDIKRLQNETKQEYLQRVKRGQSSQQALEEMVSDFMKKRKTWREKQEGIPMEKAKTKRRRSTAEEKMAWGIEKYGFVKYEDAQKLHAQRDPKSILKDEGIQAKDQLVDGRWARAPGSCDYPGVDSIEPRPGKNPQRDARVQQAIKLAEEKEAKKLAKQRDREAKKKAREAKKLEKEKKKQTPKSKSKAKTKTNAKGPSKSKKWGKLFKKPTQDRFAHWHSNENMTPQANLHAAKQTWWDEMDHVRGMKDSIDSAYLHHKVIINPKKASEGYERKYAGIQSKAGEKRLAEMEAQLKVHQAQEKAARMEYEKHYEKAKKKGLLRN